MYVMINKIHIYAAFPESIKKGASVYNTRVGYYNTLVPKMCDKIDIEIYIHLKRKIIKNSISRIIWSKKTFKSKVTRCLTRVSESPNDSSSVDQCGVGLVCGTESRPFWIWLVFNTLLLTQSSSYSGFSKNQVKKKWHVLFEKYTAV